MRNLIFRIIIGILFCGSSFGIYAQNKNNFEIGKNLDIYTQLLNEINLNYVDTINPKKLVRTSIDAMLKKLDPYTIFISEDEVDDFEIFTTGAYGGIGVGIHKKDGNVIVNSIYEGFSAHRAGMKCGDVFIEINDTNVENKKSSDVSALIKGRIGLPLTIKVRRPGIKELITLNLKRETIKIDNVPYYTILDKNIGYILLSSFTINAAKEVKNAYNELNTATKLKGLIIDLRNNGGGLMNEAVDIVNMFVEKGKEVVSTKGKITDRNRAYKTNSTPTNLNIPLAVLINKNSASASEIVAGAIQDLDRGLLIGQRSFGKGLVQNIVRLSYNSQAKITVAKYYIPSGRCIQAIDYSLKDENGMFTKIPDSLITEYKTSNGRKVYDGAGIEPDIITEPLTLSKISSSLYSKMIIFDFAIDYYSKNKKSPKLKSFKISDKLYDSFLEFIADKDYDYTTACEQSLKKLKENAVKENYFDAMKEQFNSLEKSMHHNKNADLTKYKEEIKNLIRIEILAKYYYEKGRIAASIKTDTDIKKAIELLKSKDQYTSLLQPN
jgi:carboxyl-terminal processing protease